MRDPSSSRKSVEQRKSDYKCSSSSSRKSKTFDAAALERHDEATTDQAQPDKSRPSTPPTTQPQPPRPMTARALHAYTAETADELDFRKNDILDIISDLSKEWWYARRHRGNKSGYVPSNYMLLNNTEVMQQPGWMEISRQEAEKLLLHPGQPVGLYLIRPCSQGCFAISLRSKHPKKPKYYFVQHYRLSINSAGFFNLTSDTHFPTVNELLAHYAKQADGLTSKLLRPCPKPPLPPPERFSDLEVNRECLELLERIGDGSFSEVYRAKWHHSLLVAVKTLKPNALPEQSFIQEAQLLLKAYHPHILQIMAVCTDGEPFYIVTELLTNGSMLDYLRKDKGILLSTGHLVTMMIQLAEAMAHLESLRIVHRDLRAANVLIADDAAVKLADFGLARQLDESGVYIGQGEKFPAKWTPAEAVQKARFTTKSDVWSFGVVVWEIVTFGGVPYLGLQNREVVEFVSKGYRMPNPQGGHISCDQSLYQLMLECWHANPERRPSFHRLKDLLKAYIAAADRTAGKIA